MFDEDFVPLSPVNFFVLGWDCPHQKFDPTKGLSHRCLLPNASGLSGGEEFAQVAMAWSLEGIAVQVTVQHPFVQSSYPMVSRGDGVELFFDTRDVKTSGFNTRFCHHFFFLPVKVEEYQAGEITRFRTEDAHDLCDSSLLQVEAHFKKKSYLINIFIPSQCLHGYDPEQFKRMGFTYRIHRTGGPPQHFSVVSEEYQVEQQPALWSSVRLMDENRSL